MDAPNTGGAADRMLRVEPVMGTTVTIDVRPPFVDPDAIERAVAWFHDVDRRFSLYRPDSEASRVAVGHAPARGREPGRARDGRRSPTWCVTGPTATSTPAATGPTASSTPRGS